MEKMRINRKQRTYKEIQEISRSEYKRVLEIKKKVTEEVIDLIYDNNYLKVVMDGNNEPIFHIGNTMMNNKENKIE